MVDSSDIVKSLTAKVRNIPDFPRKGIVFRDITTLLKDGQALRQAVSLLADRYKDERIDKVVGIESRGFVLGAAVADRLGAGFVPVRKRGKLPGPTRRMEYALEYGTDVVEIHVDAIRTGERVLMHDDLLATGGTMEAALKLVLELGATIVGVCFLVELSFLGGRRRLSQHTPYAIIHYDAE